MTLIQGGRTVYGQALGILMLDTRFPRLPGDVGNATTWPFPVRYQVVRGARPHRIMGAVPDAELLEPFVAAARELEASGVRAITTSCGFLAVFQRELAAAVGIPVLSSALLQVPLVARMLRPGQQVGVLTEQAENLTARHFEGLGFSSGEVPFVVKGLPPGAYFPTVFIGDALEADPARLERELVELAAALVREHPEVGAIVSECTNFVPFSGKMREAAGLPVFDLFTLGMQVYYATVGTEFRGFL
jgi:hypothetical protein